MSAQEVFASLTEDQQHVLDESDDYYCRGPSHMVSGRGWTGYRARKVFKQMRDLGILTYGPAISDEDGMLMGSGYWLSDFGKEVKKLWLASLPMPIC